MKKIKKKLLTWMLALAMCLGMCQGYAMTAQAEGPATWLVAPGVYSYGNDEKIFSEGLMQVYDGKTNTYGFINTAGQLVIPCQYNSVRDFQDGVARVHLNIVTKEFISYGKKSYHHSIQAFIDPAGQILFSWDSVWGSDRGKGIYPAGDADFHEGLVRAHSGTTQKYGFMNKAGQLVVPCLYGEVKDFSDGLAAVYDDVNAYWGYVDAAGNVALPFQYKDVKSFEDGYAPVQLADGSNEWILIDKAGRNVIPEGYEYWYESYTEDWNNFKSNGGVVCIKKDRKLYLLDKAGGMTECSIGWQVQDGMVMSSHGGGAVSVFDTMSRPLFGGKVLRESSISEGYGVPDADYEVSRVDYFIDREGNVTNLPEGVEARVRFSEGFLPVSSKATGTERWGFANTAGQVVIPCTYAKVGEFSGGVAPAKNFADKWGLIDAAGAEVLPFQYNSVKQVKGATGVFFVSDSNGTGLVAAPTVCAANGAVVSYAAKAEVDSAVNAGIATEALGGDYRAEITREQLAATAVKLYEAASGQPAPAVGATPFVDVDNVAVTQAKTLELIDGLPDGQFVPKATVPREQAAAILSGVSAKLNGTAPAEQAAKFESEGSTRKTASIEETLATAARILKKIKK